MYLINELGLVWLQGVHMAPICGRLSERCNSFYALLSMLVALQFEGEYKREAISDG